MPEWKGKGSWHRPMSVSKEERDKSYTKIFGKKLSWLEKKKIMEMFL